MKEKLLLLSSSWSFKVEGARQLYVPPRPLSQEQAKWIHKSHEQPTPRATPQQKEMFKRTTHCYMCSTLLQANTTDRCKERPRPDPRRYRLSKFMFHKSSHVKTKLCCASWRSHPLDHSFPAYDGISFLYPKEMLMFSRVEWPHSCEGKSIHQKTNFGNSAKTFSPICIPQFNNKTYKRRKTGSSPLSPLILNPSNMILRLRQERTSVKAKQIIKYSRQRCNPAERGAVTPFIDTVCRTFLDSLKSVREAENKM